MRTECLNYKYSHNALLPVSRLISTVGNKMQICTQRYNRRPYGVGLLVAGYDVSVIHLIFYFFCRYTYCNCSHSWVEVPLPLYMGSPSAQYDKYSLHHNLQILYDAYI